MLAISAGEVADHLLGVAEIDLGRRRSRRAERQARELKLGRGLRRTLADEIHGGLAQRLIGLLAQNLQVPLAMAATGLITSWR